MRRRLATALLSILGLGGPFLVLATDASSTSYQNFDSTFAPMMFNQSSPNFKMTGSVESIVGVGMSPSFSTIRSGVPLTDPPLATTPPATGGEGGGGGGGPIPGTPSGFAPTGTTPLGVTPPTLTFRSPTFLSHQVIGGTMDSKSARVVVNGSSNGVAFLSSERWQLDLPLFLGNNAIYVYAEDTRGGRTATIYGEIERMLIGDVNRSRFVDDFDLSLFTRAWKTYNFFADFNEDGRIDDFDLSLLASHWGRSY